MCSVNGIKYITIIKGQPDHSHSEWLATIKKITKCDHCGADLKTMKKLHSLLPKEREHIIREHMNKVAKEFEGIRPWRE